MCGIFGAIGAVGRLPSGAGERISAPRAHRGPGAEGRSPGAHWVFGHPRLKVIALPPGGAQPMAGSTEETQVCFNGEIYNHHALRAELEKLGQKFRSRSD